MEYDEVKNQSSHLDWTWLSVGSHSQFPPRMSQCLIITYNTGHGVTPIRSEGENGQIPPLSQRLR